MSSPHPSPVHSQEPLGADAQGRRLHEQLQGGAACVAAASQGILWPLLIVGSWAPGSGEGGESWWCTVPGPSHHCSRFIDKDANKAYVPYQGPQV